VDVVERPNPEFLRLDGLLVTWHAQLLFAIGAESRVPEYLALVSVLFAIRIVRGAARKAFKKSEDRLLGGVAN
jgi:hypothetical protein